MATKNTKDPAVMLVTMNRPDNYGTRYVDISVGIKSDDDVDGGRYVRAPRYETLAGCQVKDLAWRFYRSNTRENDPARDLYADAEAKVWNVYSMSESEAEEALKTLRTVKRRLSAQHEKYGHVSGFAEKAMRIAACFDCKTVAIDRDLYKRATGHDRRHSEGRYVWIDMSMARSFFESLAVIDTVKRCSGCERPIPNALTEDGSACGDCRNNETAVQ